MLNKESLREEHSFTNDTIFQLKKIALISNRSFTNFLFPLKRYKDNRQLTHAPVIAHSESELWNPFDNEVNWVLTAGKIENLRIASRKLNGIEIKVNEVFSFWKHIGNPNLGQGYVIGREIREGCIVPTIAGGLCQLSNALYDAALKAHFNIVERHKHTKVIHGSLAEQDRDATVKWNYIDLRFSSSFDFRIEVELTSEKLVVNFKSDRKEFGSCNDSFYPRHSDKLNDCYSCGNHSCFKHPGVTSNKQRTATTTFILDERWPEFDTYVNTTSSNTDRFIVPLRSRLIRPKRYNWTALNKGNSRSTTIQGIFRALMLRFAPKNKHNVFGLMLQLDKKIAIAAARRISVDSTHLVISQNLLPFIFDTGALGGRTFDILMTRLPLEKLHERLDHAHSNHPESSTLKDFRAPNELMILENRALTRARKIITPHSEIAEIFKNKVYKLSWQVPTRKNGKVNGKKVLFPASSIGRKGVYEIKKIAMELKLDLMIAGKRIEKENFWEGLDPEQFSGDFDEVGLVVYPTYIEHQPRLILKAISRGIPILTTSACGIECSENVKVFGLNELDALQNAVERAIGDPAKYTSNSNPLDAAALH